MKRVDHLRSDSSQVFQSLTSPTPNCAEQFAGPWLLIVVDLVGAICPLLDTPAQVQLDLCRTDCART